MPINKKLIHFNKKEKFLEELNAGNILDTSIVFIKDTQEIYTHKQYYASLADLKAAIDNKIVALTQAQYDILTTKDAKTLYIID